MGDESVEVIPRVLSFHDVGGAAVQAESGMTGIVNVNGTFKKVTDAGVQTDLGGAATGGIVGTVSPIAAPASQMQVTGLAPSTQIRYEITGRVVLPAGVATTLTLDLNGIAAAAFKPNTTQHAVAGGSDTSNTVAATQNVLDATGAGHTAVEMLFRIIVQAKSGEGARYFEWEVFRLAAASASVELPQTARGFITDTATEMSTITLTGGVGGIGIGSWMRVRALS